MVELIQQLAMLDAVLSNWDAIRAKVGPASAIWEQELAKIAARLSAANSPGDIARALDDLLDLLEDTPAYEYVRQLLARSQLGGEMVRGGLSVAPDQMERTRGGLSAAPDQMEDAALLLKTVTMSGQALGGAAGAEVEGKVVPVFFATNRKGDKNQPPEKRFSGDPADTITLGLALVTIPVAKHKVGKVETPAWWNFFADEKDASRYVVLRDVDQLESADFCTKLGKAVTDAGRGSVLVFLHGYNVSFEEAALRAAQISFDMKFQGAVVLFSWPSLGTTFGYFADGERAELSAERLVEFLRILEGGPWEQVHLVAHSMGNRVVVLGLADNPPPALPIGQIVFVAADVYVETFDQKFPKMSGIGKLKTSYTSKADRALLVSSWLHRAARIGITRGEPFARPGMETIDASTVDTSLLSLGHSYFGDKRTVITDLGYLLREGLPAVRRGLEQPPGKDYWDFPR
jgi:esterase/lipase superfamily enzyme